MGRSVRNIPAFGIGAMLLLLLCCLVCLGCTDKGGERTAEEQASPGPDDALVLLEASSVSVDIVFPSTSEESGSVTFRPSIPPERFPGLFFPRNDHPGDAYAMTMGTPGPRGEMVFSGGLTPVISAGEGSEVRFAAEALPLVLLDNIPSVSCEISVQGKAATIHPKRGSRLCFRRQGDHWVYVCGQGHLEISDESGRREIKLGHHWNLRTCLASLDSDNEFIREGAVRELGRLQPQADSRDTVDRLLRLLAQENTRMRSATTEALGLIGTEESFLALKQAHEVEADERVKSRMAESISLCAAYALLGRAESAKLAPGEAAAHYTEETTWVKHVIDRYLVEQGVDGYRDILMHADSPDPVVRDVATRILLAPFPKGVVRNLAAKLKDKEWKGELRDDSFKLLFHLCAVNDAPVLGQLLLSKGVGVDAKIQGFTPLYLAASYGGQEMARLLLANGADPSIKVGGKTAKDAAIQAGFSAIAAMLD
ncbi:MAG TPA: hypothetical protein ENO00_03905 [Deltaproteobacteria bacterium]|nr:hypothetical protein [Deltaproteobacteria bacterium]